MKRTWWTLIVIGIALASAAGGVVLARQANANYIPFFYVVGPLLMLVGACFSVMNWSVSDEYLRRRAGKEEDARRMRELWRSGWVGVVGGIVMIAVQYFLGSYVPLP